MSTDKLNIAISAAKSGDKLTARKLLSDYVSENPSSEVAWLWLSACVDSIDQKRYCLNRALAINPNNQNARKALAQLDSSPPPARTESISTQPTSSSSQPKVHRPDSRPAQAIGGQRQPSASSPQVNPRAIHQQSELEETRVGSYVKSVLLPNERVIATAKLHWVIFVVPTIFSACATCFTLMASVGLVSVTDSARDLAAIATVYFMICGLPLWVIAGLGFLKYKSTEFALTDKRIIGKTGIIRRRSLELVLEKVESISVNQSMIGRLLDFGTLVISGTGGTHQAFPTIAEPMKIKQKLNSILSESNRDPTRV